MSVHTNSQDLRRLDWRFLLPKPADSPYPSALIFGATDSQIQLLESVNFASHVYKGESDQPKGKVDFVAVLNTSSISILKAADYLKSSGTLYAEINRTKNKNFRLSPHYLQSKLEQLGFSFQGEYAVQPHFEGLEMYLPLDHTHALGWFLSNHYQARTQVQKTLKFSLNLICGNRGQRFKLFAPYFTIIATRGDQGQHFSSKWTNSSEAETAPSHSSLLMFSDRGNRVVILPFTAASKEPTRILKIPKLPTVNNRTENEQEILSLLHQKLPASISKALPVGNGVHQLGDISMGIENYLSGKTLNSFSSSEAESSFFQASDWLINFNQSLNNEITWSEHEHHAWLQNLFTEYETLFSLSTAEKQLFDKVSMVSRTLIHEPMLHVFCHRDFNIWNIMRHENDIRVIDWEGGRWGLPLCDFIHFTTHWHDHFNRCTDLNLQLQGFKSLFFTHQSKYSAVVQSQMDNYLNRLRLDQRFTPIFFCHTWIELALRRQKQLNDMKIFNSQTPRKNNRNFHFIQLLSENFDCLTTQLVS